MVLAVYNQLNLNFEHSPFRLSLNYDHNPKMLKQLLEKIKNYILYIFHISSQMLD